MLGIIEKELSYAQDIVVSLLKIIEQITIIEKL